MSLENGVEGDWGPAVWLDPTGTIEYNSPIVQTGTVMAQTSAPAAGQDRWTGWLQNIVGGAVSYAIQKDARQNGMVPARAANGQPIYSPAGVPAYVAPARGMSSEAALLIVAAIVGAVLIARKG